MNIIQDSMIDEQTNTLTLFFDFIKTQVTKVEEKNASLLNYHTPDEIKDKIDFKVHEKGINKEQLLLLVKQYIKYSVNTAHPQFFNQLYGGFNLPAFIGEIVTALTNTSMYTYEVAPVATLIENQMIQKMCKITGFEKGDGLFVTGGSNANLIAMFSARNKAFPEIKHKGTYGLAPISAFISEQAHYSFEKNANLIGMGVDYIYKIKTDENGQLIPSDLEYQIKLSKEKGEQPFFIAATAGTTVLGAFDPIDKIAEIGKKHNIWVHVDGSFGGSLILSSNSQKYFKGIEKVNSFTWNPHKLMNIPLVSSVILINDKNQLYRNFTSVNDDYIFHQTETGSCDLGKKSIQCGRKVDALKLWLAWKFFGDNGYKERTNHLIDMAKYFERKLKRIPQFEISAPRQSLTVCFRYRSKFTSNTNLLNEKIREQLRTTGKSLVNYSYIDNNFIFRWVIANADTQEEDIDNFLNIFLQSASIIEKTI